MRPCRGFFCKPIRDLRSLLSNENRLRYIFNSSQRFFFNIFKIFEQFENIYIWIIFLEVNFLLHPMRKYVRNNKSITGRIWPDPTNISLKRNINATHFRAELMRHAEYDHVRPLRRLPQLGHRSNVRRQLDAWQVLDVLVAGVDDLAQLEKRGIAGITSRTAATGAVAIIV